MYTASVGKRARILICSIVSVLAGRVLGGPLVLY